MTTTEKMVEVTLKDQKGTEARCLGKCCLKSENLRPSPTHCTALQLNVHKNPRRWHPFAQPRQQPPRHWPFAANTKRSLRVLWVNPENFHVADELLGSASSIKNLAFCLACSAACLTCEQWVRRGLRGLS